MRFLVFIISFLTLSCDLPKDPHNTFNRIKSQKLIKAGISHNPPLVFINAGDTSGIEVELIREIAKKHNARIKWTVGAESLILEELHFLKLDIAASGLKEKTPYAKKVALTKPYYKKHVLAVPPGENEWLKEVQQVLNKKGKKAFQRKERRNGR